MNAIPWYRSPVLVGLLVSLVSQVLVLLGKKDIIPPEVLSGLVETILQLVAIVAAAFAGWKRARSSVQPVTGTAAGADVKNQGGFARVGALGVLSMVALAACGTLLPAAKTFNERLAAGYTTVTAVRNAAGVWVDAKVIECNTATDAAKRTACLAAVRADAQNVQNQANEARAGLDAARAWKDLDVKTAEGRLAATLTILQTLQAYLGSKQ